MRNIRSEFTANETVKVRQTYAAQIGNRFDAKPLPVRQTYAAQVGKHFATPGPIRVRKPNPNLLQRIVRAFLAAL